MLTFVYDRTQSDVDRAKELCCIGWYNLTDGQKEEWMNGLKGCLNRSDLSRIEGNIYEIAKLLQITIQTNKDTIPDIPDASYFATLLGNLDDLRGTGLIYQTTPSTPSQPVNTYQKVNDIERILRDIYSMYVASNEALLYAGETYAGEGYGLI